MAFTPNVSTDEIYMKGDTSKAFSPVFDGLIADVNALKNEGTATPIMTVEFHLGRLDNISGAEFSATNRICCDAIPITVGTTYYLTNDKAVNMYALLYDENEGYVGLKGNIANGAAIEITETAAKYLRFSSLVGENDLKNVFKLYDTNPASTPEESTPYTKTETDALLADKMNVADFTKAAITAKVDAGGSPYALATHGHTAESVTFTDGQTFQQKLDNGTLKGADGTIGADGATGATGADGKSAYQIAVDGGYTGTSAEWIASLQGADGAQGAPGADGADGTEISANDILTKLKTVDGQNSGLDADLLDGHNTDYFATATQLTGKANTAHAHTLADVGLRVQSGVLQYNNSGTWTTVKATGLWG